MATVDNYKIKVQVEGQEQVRDLTQSLDGLQSTLNRTAAAGVAAFTALATSAARMADQMVDTADAIGISAAKLYQLNIALEQAGGQFGNASGLLRGFTQSLGDVEKGSAETINALYQLGLSKNQIENLNDEQLFQAVVNGLGKMEAGFERNRLGMILMGKAADGVDWAKMAEGSNQAIDPALEQRLRLAADAIGQIEQAFRQFQLVALEAITPILQSIKDMNITADDAKKAIQVLGALIAGAFSAATIIGIVKAVQAIRTLALAIRAAATAQALLTGLIPVVGAATVIAAIGGATAAYLALGKAMEDAADAKQNLEGPAPGAPSTTVPTPAGPQRQIGQTPAEKQLEALKQSTTILNEQNRQALEYQRIINDTIGLLDEEANRKKLNADIDKEIASQQQNINKQLLAATKERDQLQSDSSRKLANLQQQLAAATDQQQKTAIQNQITLEKDRARLAGQANSQTVAELQKQLSLVTTQGEEMRKLRLEALARAEAEQRTKDNIKAQSEANKLILSENLETLRATEMRKVISGQITEEEMRNAVELARIKTDSLQKLTDLQAQYDTAASQAEKNRIMQSISLEKQRADNAIAQKQREIEEKAALDESYAAGAVRALERIAEGFKPINMAQEAVNKTWGKISNAVDEFVNTGKFKFSDFAKSVIRDLMAMIIKAQIFAAIQTTLGAFGIKLPGLAEGGPAKAGKPYIVGEKGPELFVPKSSPMPPGLAEGGPTNPNKPYMVGEKGPELFVPKSAGTVIPNDKLDSNTGRISNDKQISAPIYNNYITNNISALDSKSVAQVFAENRKILLGTVQMAQREMPS